MAEEADLLRTIAQISITFAGFAGVVAAFGTFRLAPIDQSFKLSNGHRVRHRLRPLKSP